MGFEIDADLGDTKVAAAIDDMQDDDLESSLDLNMLRDFDLSYNFRDSWD